jgi:hypothetical protein
MGRGFKTTRQHLNTLQCIVIQTIIARIFNTHHIIMYIKHCNKLQCKRANSYAMVIYMVAYSHGSGLSPGPTPLSNINKCKYKYNMARLSNKKHMTDSWLAECFKSFGYGGGPGVEPRGPIHFIQRLSNHINQWIVTRGTNGLGHVSKLYSLPMTRVATPLDNHHQMKICHVIATSARWYGPPRGRTDCTDRYSQHPKFFPV